MDEQKTTGTLYIVATPIGNSRDMSERGREILKNTPIQNVIMAPTMEGGAETIVKLVKEAEQA